jgi:hypothetical protein
MDRSNSYYDRFGYNYELYTIYNKYNNINIMLKHIL